MNGCRKKGIFKDTCDHCLGIGNINVSGFQELLQRGGNSKSTLVTTHQSTASTLSTFSLLLPKYYTTFAHWFLPQVCKRPRNGILDKVQKTGAKPSTRQLYPLDTDMCDFMFRHHILGTNIKFQAAVVQIAACFHFNSVNLSLVWTSMPSLLLNGMLFKSHNLLCPILLMFIRKIPLLFNTLNIVFGVNKDWVCLYLTSCYVDALRWHCHLLMRYLRLNKVIEIAPSPSLLMSF